MSETYQITEDQWRQINSALLTAAGVCIAHAKEVHENMLQASFVMDDIIDAAEFAETKPLSTYPEDRRALLRLCEVVEETCDHPSAIELADRVKAILEDEAA